MIFISPFQFRIFYEIVCVHTHNHVPSGIPWMKGTAYLDVGVTSHTIHIFSGHAINLTAPESFTGVHSIKQSKNSLSPLEFFAEKVMRSHSSNIRKFSPPISSPSRFFKQHLSPGYLK